MFVFFFFYSVADLGFVQIRSHEGAPIHTEGPKYMFNIHEHLKGDSSPENENSLIIFSPLCPWGGWVKCLCPREQGSRGG